MPSTYRSKSSSTEKRLKALTQWRDGYNPKRNLTMQQVIQLCENYARGVMADLQWMFGAPFMGIEHSDPVYLTIITRRLSAIKQMDWQIKISKEFAADPLAQAQKACLVNAYEKIDNLKEAIAHLQMAVFRGYAHCAITADCLHPVEQWNVVRNGSKGAWRYNPEAQNVTFETLGAEMDMEPSDYLFREVKMPVGRIAMLKDFRCSLSEKDWDAFVEIYGVPSWLIIGPPNLPADKASEFKDAAESVAEGGSGYLPNGSMAQCADAPRGINPFEARLRYLNEMLVLAGTNGLLTVLTASGSGTLAGGAHQDAFDMLARADAAEISEVFQKQLDRRLLREAGLLKPGAKALAWFSLDAITDPDVGNVVDHITKLASAGYQTDPAQVREMTGYNVTYQAPSSPLALNSKPADQQAVILNAGAAGLLPAKKDPAIELSEAMQKDFEPIATRLQELLKEEGDNLQSASKRLLDELPELAKKIALDPKAAKLIEQEMRDAAGLDGEMDPALNSQEWRTINGSPVPIGKDGNPDFDSLEKKSPSSTDPFIPRTDDVGPVWDDSDPNKKSNNHSRGKIAFTKCAETHQDIKNAMYRESLGQIDFPYGKEGTPENGYEDGYGVSKILKKHPDAAGKIPGVIAHGKIYNDPDRKGDFCVVSKRNLVVLRKSKEENAYLMTGYESSLHKLGRIQKSRPIENSRSGK